METLVEKRSRLKGVLRKKHVADAVTFLASDESEFVTGLDLAVDGVYYLHYRTSAYARGVAQGILTQGRAKLAETLCISCILILRIFIKGNAKHVSLRCSRRGPGQVTGKLHSLFVRSARRRVQQSRHRNSRKATRYRLGQDLRRERKRHGSMC
ncbi:hypothetical protein FNV43_RR20473 [Rhamnella rubrinervis]|uniref:Uncharacterized protein n=1 Tax=Rhamnella rubrinervis TaxID=2594499 RepID=A0A8K0DUG5_9ROSA|nr:hypothetical protein FNV43_RR20473 [Rhamnella rubrinervis]